MAATASMACAVVGFEDGVLHTAPFSNEDETEATGAVVFPNWMRAVDAAVLEPTRRADFERITSKRVRGLCMAAWAAVRGDLGAEATAQALERLADKQLLGMDACAALTVWAALPVGLVTLVHFLTGKPTQERERMPWHGDVGAQLTCIPGGSSSDGWAFAEKSLLARPVRTYNADAHSHTLVDVMAALVEHVATTPEGSPASHHFLDCLGSVLHMCHASATHYSNPKEAFADSMLREDYAAYHAPMTHVWHILLKQCCRQPLLRRSVLALYALLRPGAAAAACGEAEQGLVRQVEALVLFSVVGHLFPPLQGGGGVPASAVLAPPAWFYGLEVLTEEMHVFVAGIHHMWHLNDLGLQTSFCRLVMETQLQLPLLVLRRGKCCYSNAFMSTLW